MLCLGLKKSLLSLRLKLTAQVMAQCTNDQSFQAPPSVIWYILAQVWLRISI